MTGSGGELGRVSGIAIGASVGGVEALSILLPALPKDLGAPVFVVLHQPRDRPSLLVDIFKVRCDLPVREAEDKEEVERGTIYFAPPDYHLLVDEGPRLALSADELVHYSRPSIDVLFESAAEVYGDRLLGILLTGANEDGAAGMEAIHRAGGATVVQEPETALAASMPASALARTQIDRVLPLDGIAALLRSLGGRTVHQPLSPSGRR
jgi:two-component system, chemotaxis family, protein-glutamate methylesterase/glutaminase